MGFIVICEDKHTNKYTCNCSHQIVQHLLGDSCSTDAGSGGDGEPYAPIVRLTTRRHADRAVISIYDNGSGIPEDIIEKVFNPFFTTKPTDEGTGLGLALSNDIIREHGGSIHIESAEGEFTEMIIELPLRKPDILVENEGTESSEQGLSL